MPTVREELLKNYERELTYIRQMGVEFAKQYPKQARRLLLEPDHCEDPHVERLLEGFALLAARIHLKLEDDFPQISSALLEILFPHYTRPVPSMSVVELLPRTESTLSTGFPIPRNSMLKSNQVNGIQCKFQTAYDTVLWPIEVKKAVWGFPDETKTPSGQTAVATLKLTLECLGNAVFKGFIDKDRGLKLRFLRFYLAGAGNLINTLYELLFNNCCDIKLRDPDGNREDIRLSPCSSFLKPVGFAENEGVLSYSRRSFLGYRLLQEYFTFPEKFFFVDLHGLERLVEAGFEKRAEIHLDFSRFERPERHHTLESGVTRRTLRLGCTPIINLFSQIAEPINVDHTRYEYPVVPDVRRRTTTEIFSVDEVTGHNRNTRQPLQYHPFYSFQHAVALREKPAFWHLSRTRSELRDDLPSQVALSFVDLTGAYMDLDADIISVRCMCTDGDLPGHLPASYDEAEDHQNDNDKGDFHIEGFSEVRRVVALRPPTQTIRPPLGEATLWNLISHLSLNYLSLVEEGSGEHKDEGKRALQELLRLYNFTDLHHFHDQISGIQRVSSQRQIRLVSSEEGVSMMRGTRVEMMLNEDLFAGGAFLFASVLDRFFGLYASMNSFSQLVVSTTRRQKPLREWPPRAGNSILM